VVTSVDRVNLIWSSMQESVFRTLYVLLVLPFVLVVDLVGFDFSCCSKSSFSANIPHQGFDSTACVICCRRNFFSPRFLHPAGFCLSHRS
jgi:hypothetical protein